MTLITLKIIFRPSFPTKREEINLIADVTQSDISVDRLTELVYQIETAINEHIPQIRVHASIEVK